MNKEMIKNAVRKASYVATAATTALIPVVAHAEAGGASTTTTNDSLINSLVTGFTSTTNDALGGIAKIAPIALPIIGAIVIVRLGIKIFRRVSNG